MSKIIIGGHEITVHKDYSTTEQFTGQYWIDGKPIYRKVCTGTVSTYLDDSKRRSFDLGTLLTDVDHCISYSGYWKILAGGVGTGYEYLVGISPFDAAGEGVYSTIIVTDLSNHLITGSIYTRTSWNVTSVSYNIVLEYTKTE